MSQNSRSSIGSIGGSPLVGDGAGGLSTRQREMLVDGAKCGGYALATLGAAATVIGEPYAVYSGAMTAVSCAVLGLSYALPDGQNRDDLRRATDLFQPLGMGAFMATAFASRDTATAWEAAKFANLAGDLSDLSKSLREMDPSKFSDEAAWMLKASAFASDIVDADHGFRDRGAYQPEREYYESPYVGDDPRDINAPRDSDSIDDSQEWMNA